MGKFAHAACPESERRSQENDVAQFEDKALRGRAATGFRAQMRHLKAPPARPAIGMRARCGSPMRNSIGVRRRDFEKLKNDRP
jgi:hypothetical protein